MSAHILQKIRKNTEWKNNELIQRTCGWQSLATKSLAPLYHTRHQITSLTHQLHTTHHALPSLILGAGRCWHSRIKIILVCFVRNSMWVVNIVARKLCMIRTSDQSEWLASAEGAAQQTSINGWRRRYVCLSLQVCAVAMLYHRHSGIKNNTNSKPRSMVDHLGLLAMVCNGVVFWALVKCGRWEVYRSTIHEIKFSILCLREKKWFIIP